MEAEGSDSDTAASAVVQPPCDSNGSDTHSWQAYSKASPPVEAAGGVGVTRTVMLQLTGCVHVNTSAA